MGSLSSESASPVPWRTVDAAPSTPAHGGRRTSPRDGEGGGGGARWEREVGWCGGIVRWHRDIALHLLDFALFLPSLRRHIDHVVLMARPGEPQTSPAPPPLDRRLIMAPGPRSPEAQRPPRPRVVASTCRPDLRCCTAVLYRRCSTVSVIQSVLSRLCYTVSAIPSVLSHQYDTVRTLPPVLSGSSSPPFIHPPSILHPSIWPPLRPPPPLWRGCGCG